MRNVLFIAYYFPPLGGGGVQRSVKFVKYLPQEGYSPIVVTTLPGNGEDRWSPRDREMLDEIPAEVAIYRTESAWTADRSNRLAKVIRNRLGLTSAFGKWWIASAYDTAKRAAHEHHVDLIYASMSPFETAPAAMRLSRELHVPWIADLRDPWALDEMRIRTYVSVVDMKLDRARMSTSLSSATCVIMNTPEARNAVIRTFPHISADKIKVITNGYDHQDFNHDPVPRRDEKFRIVHAGNLHTGSAPEEKTFTSRLMSRVAGGIDVSTRSHLVLLKAIELWMGSNLRAAKDLEVVLVGATTAADLASISSFSYPDLVRFTGYLSHRDTVDLVRTADLLFLPMHTFSTRRKASIVPGKTYEYMASGRPILAAVPDGDAKDFLEQCGSAFFCRPDDAAAMAQLLEKVYRSWQQKQAATSLDAHFVSRFERKVLTLELARAFDGVLTMCGPGSRRPQ